MILSPSVPLSPVRSREDHGATDWFLRLIPSPSLSRAELRRTGAIGKAWPELGKYELGSLAGSFFRIEVNGISSPEVLGRSEG